MPGSDVLKEKRLQRASSLLSTIWGYSGKRLVYKEVALTWFQICQLHDPGLHSLQACEKCFQFVSHSISGMTSLNRLILALPSLQLHVLCHFPGKLGQWPLLLEQNFRGHRCREFLLCFREENQKARLLHLFFMASTLNLSPWDLHISVILAHHRRVCLEFQADPSVLL